MQDPMIKPIWRDDEGHVIMIDQRRLPHEEVTNTYRSADEVAQAITDMVIRGAPAIGVAAAMGLALEARRIDPAGFAEAFAACCDRMAKARPTAVNLFWAIERMQRVVALSADPAERLDALDREADLIFSEDIEVNRSIGAHGLSLIPDGARILTHCNTGALATAGIGTALGVIRAAAEAGKNIRVYADETRPYLQGSRLTAWELLKEGIDVTILPDSAAGHLMARGAIDLAIVGTDRTVRNGDVANKIGTYQVAVLCRYHELPFYVAAPTSTIDLATADGSGIPIEERSPDEVRNVFGQPIAPRDVKAANPAFDVTPAELVTAIITENGVARAPYEESLAALCERG